MYTHHFTIHNSILRKNLLQKTWRTFLVPVNCNSCGCVCTHTHGHYMYDYLISTQSTRLLKQVHKTYITQVSAPKVWVQQPSRHVTTASCIHPVCLCCSPARRHHRQRRLRRHASVAALPSAVDSS